MIIEDVDESEIVNEEKYRDYNVHQPGSVLLIINYYISYHKLKIMLMAFIMWILIFLYICTPMVFDQLIVNHNQNILQFYKAVDHIFYNLFCHDPFDT